MQDSWDCCGDCTVSTHFDNHILLEKAVDSHEQVKVDFFGSGAGFLLDHDLPEQRIDGGAHAHDELSTSSSRTAINHFSDWLHLGFTHADILENGLVGNEVAEGQIRVAET